MFRSTCLGDKSINKHKEVVSNEVGRTFLGGRAATGEGPAMCSSPAILLLDLVASI